MKVIGYTTGVFDLFHVGHLNLLRNAKALCDTLIVGVATDELTYELKRKNPIVRFRDRLDIVKGIRYVDHVLPESSDDKLEAWRRLKFNRIFKGDDWKGTPKWQILEQEFKKRGVGVVFLPYTDAISTTALEGILRETGSEDILRERGFGVNQGI